MGENSAGVGIGIIGLGNVGMGARSILTENADQIALKLGFPLHVRGLCSRNVASKQFPTALQGVHKTSDWREVVDDPEIQIIAELVGGSTVAREIVDAAI